MFKLDILDDNVADLGLLIGLLTADGDDGSVNVAWFSDPFSELKKSPTRVAGFLRFLNSKFPHITDTSCALVDHGEVWHSIYSAAEDQATGLCLVIPKPNSTSGFISLGLFDQLSLENLTISIHARLPLFHLNEGQLPQFVMASEACRIAIDVYSSSRLNLGSEGFNMLSAAASFDSTFTTNFGLHFYDAFDPERGIGTEVSGHRNDVVTALKDLMTQSNYWLGKYIGDSSVTIGDLLSAAGVVKQTGTADSGDLSYSFDLETLKSPTPALKDFLKKLVTGVFYEMVTAQEPLVAIEGGGIYVAHDADSHSYGLRLVIPDLQITAPDSAGPQVKVQLGKGLANDTSDNTWLQRSSNSQIEPGVEVLFLTWDGNTLSTTSQLELNSIGVDVQGSGTSPLFNINGYVMKGAELRLYLKYAGDICTFGAAASLDGLGIPLGGGITGSTSNPVAHSLLSAGSSEQSGPGADNEPVNPTFSASVAWISQGTGLNFQLYADDGSPTDKIWFPVQRAFGPLHCQRLGIEWTKPNPDDTLSFLFDGDVVAGGLEVDLHGLAVGIPLKSPGDLSSYHLGLDGLDITYEQGPVEISGGLLEAHVKVDDQDVIEYNGEALIKASSWAITALGSWASINGQPSLFIFAFLNAPIGGPPFFFVTGLSAGFGYNRSFTIPPQDQVQDFPFVAGLSDPSKVGGADAGPSEALQTIQKWVQPAQGVNWLAVGVQFTSFKLINSNALVVIEFGRHFQIAILGLSRIKLPQTGSITYAYVELGLEVIIDPADGFFSATAVITPNSYVIDPDCHLTGGFAFCVWFGNNPHAGDFVLTIGGYHPQFNKPAWYPDEPRLGFNWQVSDQVTIKGGAYFALTPSCIMGGGSLDVEFHSGDLRAWFTAYADFLIQWKPFYYLADIGISIGVSYRLHLLFCTTTIKVELGADLTMWGPPTGGKVHVHLWCVSFTVSFGPSFGQGNDYLGWGDFQSLLPANGEQTAHQNRPHAMLRAAAPGASDSVPLKNVVKIVLNAGQTPGSTTGRWLVRADEFVFSIQTAFPLTKIDFVMPSAPEETTDRVNSTDDPSVISVDADELSSKDANAPSCARASDGYYVGVRPMGIICANSKLTVTVADEFSVNQDVKNGWSWNKKTGSVPEAVWGQPLPKTDTPAAAANTLPGRLMGLEGVGPKPHPPQGPAPIPIDNLSYEPINPNDENYLPFSQSPQTNQPQASATSLQTIATTITKNSAADSPTANRAAIFAALTQFGATPGSNGDLTALASNINLSYTASPMLGSPMAG